MKIVTIVGARPQFIKAGTVSREIARQKKLGKPVDEIIVHTGQHYDANMSDIFFEEMNIPKPDYHLGIHGKTHGAMTGQMLEKIEEVLQEEQPDWVMVYGDTNSTLAGALAASKLHIGVAHVEAGLRSFNMKMPEEVNRILTDRVSSLLFCPTDTAVNNLMNEGYEAMPCRIVKCGDVMQDGAMFYRERAVQPDTVLAQGFVLCTVHRAENTDDPKRLHAIFEALQAVSKQRQVVVPLHPRTRKKIDDYGIELGSLHVIDPVGYLEMVWLIDHCSLVMTDSGGLQKEAYFFDKFCITLRDETEWIELVEQGVNVLVGAHKQKILETFSELKGKPFPPGIARLYGDGDAGRVIVATLLDA